MSEVFGAMQPIIQSLACSRSKLSLNIRVRLLDRYGILELLVARALKVMLKQLLNVEGFDVT